MLPPGVRFEKLYAMGLTEPQNGSDASGLRSKAVKVANGYKLTGEKRWIGNGTVGDVIVWAQNTNEANKVQAFVVERGSQGFTATKMKGKMALRGVQNAELTMKDVFVPERNKLEKAKDFG